MEQVLRGHSDSGPPLVKTQVKLGGPGFRSASGPVREVMQDQRGRCRACTAPGRSRRPRGFGGQPAPRHRHAATLAGGARPRGCTRRLVRRRCRSRTSVSAFYAREHRCRGELGCSSWHAEVRTEDIDHDQRRGADRRGDRAVHRDEGSDAATSSNASPSAIVLWDRPRCCETVGESACRLRRSALAERRGVRPATRDYYTRREPGPDEGEADPGQATSSTAARDAFQGDGYFELNWSSCRLRRSHAAGEQMAERQPRRICPQIGELQATRTSPMTTEATLSNGMKVIVAPGPLRCRWSRSRSLFDAGECHRPVGKA